MKDNLFYVNAVVLGTLVVQLLMIVCVKCYIGSLRERNAEYDYKPVDSDGNKVSLQEKQNSDKQAIHDKYA